MAQKEIISPEKKEKAASFLSKFIKYGIIAVGAAVVLKIIIG